MKYLLYDGTLDGLFTIIFTYYREIPEIKIEKEGQQTDFLEKVFIKTDIEKSQRVKKAIREKLGEDFYFNLIKNFKSKDPAKDDLIARIVKLSFIKGENFTNSSNKSAVRFRENAKNYGYELHHFKGFTRFREIQEGFLFAEIEAENDVLEDLSSHFLRRLPAEKFIIYDKLRKRALVSVKGEASLVDIVDLDIRESDEEKFFQDLWKGFYDAIAIKERANEKLMISNMPKKYWKYLPERQKE